MPTRIYHWKHGWIPLTHYAALQKAHYSHSGAAKIMERHGITPEGGHHGGEKSVTSAAHLSGLKVGDRVHVHGTSASVPGVKDSARGTVTNISPQVSVKRRGATTGSGSRSSSGTTHSAAMSGRWRSRAATWTRE